MRPARDGRSPLPLPCEVLAILAWPLVVGARAFLTSRNLAVGDGQGYMLGMRAFSAAVWRSGHVPLWNPFVYAGFPQLGALQAGELYAPGILPYFVLPPGAAYDVVLYVHLAGTGLLAYLLARELGAGRGGALAAGLLWSGSGWLWGQIGHLNVLTVAAWLPGILWAAERLMRRPTAARSVLLAAFVALAWLAGHPQTFVYELLALLLYVVARGGQEGWLASPRRWALLLLAAALAVAWGAPLLVAAEEARRQSVRAAVGYDFLVYGSFPPYMLVRALFPGLFGGWQAQWPAFATSYWGSFDPNELAFGTGIVGACLAAVGLLLPREPRRGGAGQPARLPWVLLGAVAVFLALGEFNPLYRWVLRLPGLGLFRVPARYMMIADLSLAMLGGLGVDRLARASASGLRAGRATLRRAAAVSLGVLALGWLAVFAERAWIAAGRSLPGMNGLLLSGQRLQRALATLQPGNFTLLLPTLLVAVAVAGLLGWARRPGRGAEAAALAVLLLAALSGEYLLDRWMWPTIYPEPREPAFIQEVRARLGAGPAAPPGSAAPPGRAAWYRWWLGGQSLAWGPARNMLWALPAPNGNDPLAPAAFTQALGLTPWRSDGSTRLPALLRADDALALLGVRVILLPREEAPLLARDPRYRLLLARDGFVAYENLLARGRAWAASPGGTVAVREDRPGYARLAVSCAPAAGSASCPVVFPERWDPGWSATVDGEPAALHPYRGLVMAVQVPAGSHQVVLRFAPPGWALALALAAAATLAAGVVLGAGRRRSPAR
ncbi:MAG: YfhO family protein [Chloroflexi bacterium]|nr:YfhO family protein [Chloroflexota bacterium]